MIFTEPLAAAIVKGEKTQTRRLPSLNPNSPWRTSPPLRYPVGKRFTINPGRGVGRVAEAEVTLHDFQYLRNVNGAQARAEGFRSLFDFREAWLQINGSFDPEQSVHVIEFKLVGADCGGCLGNGLRDAGGYTAVECADCFGTGVEVSVAAKALIARVRQHE